jgi:hypothetical protein
MGLQRLLAKEEALRELSVQSARIPHTLALMSLWEDSRFLKILLRMRYPES